MKDWWKQYPGLISPLFVLENPAELEDEYFNGWVVLAYTEGTPYTPYPLIFNGTAIAVLFENKETKERVWWNFESNVEITWK